MNQEQIKTLIDALAASELAELEFSENGSTLRLVKQAALAARAPRRAGVAGRQARVPAAERVAPQPAQAQAPVSTECLAPLYGVVHLQPTPDEPPFVQAGQAIRAGQILCVIEAMKVFNEVRAERDATVQAVLVRSGQEVEAGQPLFRFDAE
ncbi:acetyl-CoA carboxylase biotin carboxyl carrier protein subunit [Variovorax sp. WS11]|uniref:acetyl-CoA carboxylase biotin carboxyl carrier protein n=1 Tax=Variovorax sp. WS11 TaxID=1105204 RepID=UPI000D0DEABF|nr:biotin/lipoyl-containing protein [Variovorax sp. WS11]NDZ11669.1 biotin/lipoyl-binding protein [Variovorax sp. WS11]PSL86496.1 acetyl-CoA carboxylase biotin carboxyl carrier protein subunit [Variovorax sp. WS11]